jgi:hypothetical protein
VIERTSRRAELGKAVDGLVVRHILGSTSFALASTLFEPWPKPQIVSSRSVKVVMGTIVITMTSFGGSWSWWRAGLGL